MFKGKSDQWRRGVKAEDLAESYLTSAGFTILGRNYRCQQGEIDLIARRGQTLHFVEVKGRSSQRKGTALEQITRHQMYRISRAAQHYLRNQCDFKGLRLYFSVIGIDLASSMPRISWVPNAFEAPI